jgi:hypothetical protein
MRKSSREAKIILAWAIVTLLALSCSGVAQSEKPKKVFVITDMEGVSGIFDSDLQVNPFQSPRWRSHASC